MLRPLPENIKNHMQSGLVPVQKHSEPGQTAPSPSARQPRHHHNKSLFTTPLNSPVACVDEQTLRSEAQSRILHRATHSAPKAFYAANRDKPLPPLGDIEKLVRKGETMTGGGPRNERDDLSQGSFLDDAEVYMSGQESSVEDNNPFDLEDYLEPYTTASPPPPPASTIRARDTKRPRVPTSSRSQPPISRVRESSRPRTLVDNTLLPSMTTFRPSPIQTDSNTLERAGLDRSASEGEILHEISPSSNALQPKASPLPDPSIYPDPYPHGLPYHHLPTALPPLSSGSASTRSSAYTNPGSTISMNGIQEEFSNVRVASGDMEVAGGIGVGITSDSVVEMLSRASNGSSLSSGSRKSHGSPMERRRRADFARTMRSPSQSEEIPPPLQYERPERTLRSQPSYDSSWQRDHEDREDFITSEEEFDYGESQDIEEEEEEVEKEDERTAAIVIAEEGRGLIVHGEGMPVHALAIQSGITHLLVGGSSTPNSVPSFLASALPQICTTLLALDISANFLASLSPALASCSTLEELNISSNPLRALPEFLAELVSLRLLIADSTGISTIPTPLAALEKLSTLSVRRNKMHALPSWLCTLPCLESLLVDGNPFQGPWRALVEPLLAKIPMTPMYPPSTPMFPQLSASSTTSTTVEPTDTSDADDLTDHEEPQASGAQHSLRLPASAPVGSFFPANDEDDHTITPASVKLSKRAATAPSPELSPQAPRTLSRTRTTPSRSFYDRNREERKQSGGPSTMTWAGDRSADPSMSVDPSPSFIERQKERGEIRRMHSADELRRAMQAGSASTSQLLESPPRPALPHSATSASGLQMSENMEALAQQRRFASLGVASRGPSRAGSRPPLSANLWGEQAIDEDGDADVESPPRPTRSRPATPLSRRERIPESEDAEQLTHVRLKKLSKEEKSGSGRKWGFLKKMSMGKLRGMDGPSSASKPSSSISAGRARAQTYAAQTPSRLSPPKLEVDVMPSNPTSSLSSPPTQSLRPGLSHKPSTDKLRIPSTPLTPSPGSAGLLVPPSPNIQISPRSAKRRSFLPLDGPPALNIPIPSSTPFLGGVTASNGVDDQDETSRQPSPIVESPEEMNRKEEDRLREANARALRSVMAYLKDMNDLTMLSQGSVLSMYGATPLMDRSRRPTLVEGSRMQSEASIDSIDSSSSAPTTVSSQLRSLESRSINRSVSSNATMSVATSDSGGSSGEGRESKDDRGKRVMVVREIVSTERTYVKGLQELVDIYIKPAASPVNIIGGVGSSSKETVVPAAERKIVFGGLESLFSFHKESFLPALEAAAAPLLKPDGLAADADSDGKLSSDVAMAVGRMFVSHAAFMKMYSTYINNFENSVQRIRQWVSDRPGTSSGVPSTSITPSSSSAQLATLGLAMSSISAPNSVLDNGMSGRTAMITSSQRKRIKSYLKRCRLNPRHSQLNLEGYLLLPVQRIPRYKLLLEELGRSTPPPAESLDDPLERALNEISSLATNMNEGKREAESRRKLVQWQARIRGKFPSPLVQPHRRLIMDGKLLLTRIVRKQTMSFEVLDSHGDTSSVAVDCLAPELNPRPLYGILCNDLFVLCRDPSNGQDPNSPVDLWAVLRMQTMPQPTSIVHGNALRIIDTKAILYLEAPSTSEALTWFRAINMHVPTKA